MLRALYYWNISSGVLAVLGYLGTCMEHKDVQCSKNEEHKLSSLMQTEILATMEKALLRTTCLLNSWCPR